MTSVVYPLHTASVARSRRLLVSYQTTSRKFAFWTILVCHRFPNLTLRCKPTMLHVA